MKKYIFILLSIAISPFYLSAQKVTKINISGKCSVEEALAKTKEAGIKADFGSRDYLNNVTSGKITLWQTLRDVPPIDFYCVVTAIHNNGITTLTFTMPHNPQLIGSYKKEIKKIIKHLVLPEMMVGEYFEGIE
jgi:hypothetical protein